MEDMYNFLNFELHKFLRIITIYRFIIINIITT